MFTGIIEDLGKIIKVGTNNLLISTKLDDINTGDSISINGICLTVVSISDNNVIAFDFSPETNKRTNLIKLKANDLVNVERALKVGKRIGGHFITGHIEGVEKILRIANIDNSYIFSFTMSDAIKKYIVSKGSVGIDGVSLTVAEISSKEFSVSLIPHTLKNTTLGFKKPGDIINFEPDVLAKYTENLTNNKENKITLDFLKENGF